MECKLVIRSVKMVIKMLEVNVMKVIIFDILYLIIQMAEKGLADLGCLAFLFKIN